MNAEQKQQAKQLIADWTNVSKTSTPTVWFLNGDCMAGFLQELVDAPDSTPPSAKWRLGDMVQKVRGSKWRGKVVGFYSTEATPIGYSIESAFEPGSVQVWPEAVLVEWDSEK